MRLTKRYPSTTAVDSIDLEVGSGEFVTLLGPSGSGKTTTLMMVAGFTPPTAGEISIDDRPITGIAPEHRNIGVVFQNYALFPHMTVLDNVAFPLRMRRQPKAAIRVQVERALEMVRLAGLGDRLPRQLSGGQQQRVALARALVFDPGLLLMDEPLGALDRNLREQMKLEIKRIHNDVGVTVLYVTHDQEEALTMSDRVALMNRGRIAQLGSAEDLYERPADRFVAGFVGRSTFLAGTVEAPGHFRTDGGLFLACHDGRAGRAALALRPERLEIGPDPRSGLDNSLPGTVEFVSYLGALIDIHVRLSPNDRLVVQIANRHGGFTPEVGQAVHVGWPASAGQVFNE